MGIGTWEPKQPADFSRENLESLVGALDGDSVSLAPEVAAANAVLMQQDAGAWAGAEGFDEVSLHETTTDDMGVARMSHIDGLDLPAGETVTLKPGGLHIMFMGLDGDPFEEGEKIPATLTFEKAGTLEVIFNVESRRGHDAGGMDHGAH